MIEVQKDASNRSYFAEGHRLSAALWLGSARQDRKTASQPDGQREVAIVLFALTWPARKRRPLGVHRWALACSGADGRTVGRLTIQFAPLQGAHKRGRGCAEASIWASSFDWIWRCRWLWWWWLLISRLEPACCRRSRCSSSSSSERFNSLCVHVFFRMLAARLHLLARSSH